MNVLITGGAGYIGSHVSLVLIEAGYEIVIFDNLSNSDISVINRLEKYFEKKIPFIYGDIRNNTLIKKVLIQYNIDAVIHLAGLKAVNDSAVDPIKYYDNNVVGSISLMTAMSDCNVHKIVFSSSATVYGNPQYLPYDESHPTNPINPYGRTKLQVEQIIHDLVSSNKVWRSVILRYFNPVGAHDSGVIGENPAGIPDNLMPYISQVVIGRLPLLKIFGDDYPTKDGTCERDYIHVMDLAEGHLAALNYSVYATENGNIFNLGTGVPTSVFDLVYIYEKATGVKVPYKVVSRRIGDLPIYYASSKKALNILNWKPKRSVEEMCFSAFRWQNQIN
jgi:UDP-glucose 4-epimerase